MPKEKVNFPGRAQRKALLEELRTQLQDPAAAQNEFFREYLKAMEELDAKMEALSREDERTGVPRSLTKEDADALCGLMLTAAVHGEHYLAGTMENEKVGEGVPRWWTGSRGSWPRIMKSWPNTILPSPGLCRRCRKPPAP